MLRKMVELMIGYVDDITFNEALEMTEQDIKANRIKYNLPTKIEDCIGILVASIRLLKRQNSLHYKEI